jgi:hypothetical protein
MLQRGASQRSAVARAAHVDHDHVAAAELLSKQRSHSGRVEDACRRLAGPSGDQEQRWTRRRLRRALALDLQRDRPRDSAGPIDRDDDAHALAPGRRAEVERVRGGREARHSNPNGCPSGPDAFHAGDCTPGHPGDTSARQSRLE